MIAALALLAMAGAYPQAQTVSAPATVRPAVVRVRRPLLAPALLQDIDPSLQQSTVCAAHMELLMEKLSARHEEPDASFMMVQEYWQDRLPDPDSKDAVSDEAFSRIKDSLNAGAEQDAQQYLAGLQECVMAAARGGALD